MSATQEVITATEVRSAEQKRASLIEKMANKYGLEPNRMMATLKATAFKGEVTNEQMAALLIVADQHGLNPWTKELYAFPSRQGIVPVVSVDGWARIANDHPAFNGMSFEQDDTKCTCTIYRKDREHPIVVTEYLEECKRPTEPWSTHPKRMLRHKAMIQCARLAFSFSGIYDPDEGERVLAAENAIDVTPQKLSPVKLREVVEGLNSAVQSKDGETILKIWNPLSNEQRLYVWDQMRSYETTALRKMLDLLAKTNGFGDLPSWSIELLKSCKNGLELDKAWKSVQSAFEEADQEIPDAVTMACDEARSSMGAI